MFYKSGSIVITNYNGEKILEKFPKVFDPNSLTKSNEKITVVQKGKKVFAQNPDFGVIKYEGKRFKCFFFKSF